MLPKQCRAAEIPEVKQGEILQKKLIGSVEISLIPVPLLGLALLWLNEESDDNHVIILLLTVCGTVGSSGLSSYQCQLQGWVQHLEREITCSTISNRFTGYSTAECTRREPGIVTLLAHLTYVPDSHFPNYPPESIHFLSNKLNMSGKASQIQGAISASDEKVNCQSLCFDMDEANAQCCCPVSITATTVDPSSSGIFWSQSSWILCHTITKSNLKLYV